METRKGLLLLLSLAMLKESSGKEEFAHQKSHHRQKRVLWFTNDGRIALPPGTVMTITPTLALPFVRHPPYGFLSNMTISLPFTSESAIWNVSHDVVLRENFYCSKLIARRTE
jgi:hypothetical protein